MWVLIPVIGGIIAVYLLMQPSAKADTRFTGPTPPGGDVPPGTVASGGPRAVQYMSRLDTAYAAWSIASMLSKDLATTTLKGTIEVVKGMAANDAVQGRITAQDLAQINAKADAMYKDVSAAAAAPAPTPSIAPAAGPTSMVALRTELDNVKAGYAAGRITAAGVESLVWDLMNRSIQLKDEGAISQQDYDAFRDERSRFLQEVRSASMDTSFQYD